MRTCMRERGRERIIKSYIMPPAEGKSGTSSEVVSNEVKLDSLLNLEPEKLMTLSGVNTGELMSDWNGEFSDTRKSSNSVSAEN